MSETSYDVHWRRAAKAIKDASKDPRLDDDDLYIYALMALVSNEDGKVLEDDVLKANRDPVLSSMAAGAVSVTRHGNVL